MLDVPGSPVTLVWKMVGADITPSGDQVVSGYFYADPDDFAYGSVYNPEVFVKIYIAANGWANIAFNHVTVDPVTVYSAHQLCRIADPDRQRHPGNRLVEHTYTGVAIDTTLQSIGWTPGNTAAVQGTHLEQRSVGQSDSSTRNRPSKPDLERGRYGYDPQRRPGGQRLFLRQPR